MADSLRLTPKGEKLADILHLLGFMMDGDLDNEKFIRFNVYRKLLKLSDKRCKL